MSIKASTFLSGRETLPSAAGAGGGPIETGIAGPPATNICSGERCCELLGAFSWRNIGPATMMGRISAIDAWREDYRVVLIGASSGGIFKSTNAWDYS